MNLMLNVFVGSLLASLCVAQSKLQFEFKVILRVYSGTRLHVSCKTCYIVNQMIIFACMMPIIHIVYCLHKDWIHLCTLLQTCQVKCHTKLQMHDLEACRGLMMTCMVQT